MTILQLFRTFQVPRLFALMPIILISCSATKAPDQALIKTRGRRFVDSHGRQTIWHGISVVNKSKSRNYLGPETEKDFAAMREWGFNVVRLGIIWDGLEPEPGVYDDAYLEGIDQRIEWARQHHIYIFLDMHQDLYSVLFSDGAPEWATMTDDLPHTGDSPVWSDAYFSSPAVQRAWDHFWDNSPASDGMGLQDHYAAAWQYLAQRYKADTTVIAYDIMNEPFMGSEAASIFPAMLSAGARAIAERSTDAPSTEELAARWMTVQGRAEILELLSDIEIYKRVIDETQPIYNEFEKSKLMPMYRRVARAIRRVDKNHMLFLETTMGSNMGVYTAIEPLTDEKGDRDPQQAYAPHGYDLVTDTPAVNSPNFDRVELIFSRHNETARRLNMPMIVGEWGAYGRHKNTFNAAEQIAGFFEKFLASDAYWDYTGDLDQLDHFRALCRPYPQRIAGELQSYTFAQTTGFECVWEEDGCITAPSVIYVPEWLPLDASKINLQPPGAFTIQPTARDGKSHLVFVQPLGQSATRRLVIGAPI